VERVERGGDTFDSQRYISLFLYLRFNDILKGRQDMPNINQPLEARMSYADRVNYRKLSPRILDSISNLEDSKTTILKNNVQALLFDKYEQDHKIYWVVVSYRTPEIAIECDTGDDAIEALKWFRDNGYKSVSFTDSEYSSSRTYSLESTDKDSDLKINLQCRFDNGTCQFVSEPTGEFEDVAEQVAVPAHKRQVMKRVLKCGSTEIPSVV